VPNEEDARAKDDISPTTMARAAEAENFDLTQGYEAKLAWSTNSESNGAADYQVP
jgi:hypothetical protein